MIFLDSSVLIDYFNGINNRQVDILDSLLGEELISIGDYVYLEVLQGFKFDKDFIKAQNLLDYFVFFDLGGKDLMLKSANNYRILRKKGFTIRKTIDTIIATYCIENNLTLLHNDKDFNPFIKFFDLNVMK